MRATHYANAIDGTHNLKKICTDIYPQEFLFAISVCDEQLIEMVSKCLNEDRKLTLKYQTLQRELASDFELSSMGVVPLALETFLQ
jgi:hypothetical protein